jgi:hypothetical protein
VFPPQAMFGQIINESCCSGKEGKIVS